MFEPGAYYVGDPIVVLQADDLRQILFESGGPSGVVSGQRDLLASAKFIENFDVCYMPYFLAKLRSFTGTLYDAQNNGWGFNFGVFGCVPWEWVGEVCESHKVVFTESFECVSTDDSVTIGHLHFTLNPQ
jgi:hypothetical protein